jgi:hypothetical protein
MIIPRSDCTVSNRSVAGNSGQNSVLSRGKWSVITGIIPWSFNISLSRNIILKLILHFSQNQFFMQGAQLRHVRPPSSFLRLGWNLYHRYFELFFRGIPRTMIPAPDYMNFRVKVVVSGGETLKNGRKVEAEIRWLYLVARFSRFQLEPTITARIPPLDMITIFLLTPSCHFP